MTRTIIVNGTEIPAFGWFEPRLPEAGEEAPPAHMRDQELLEEGVSDLRPGEALFKCDQTFVFDTTLELKGDGRKFVIIASDNGRHVAKPY